jgi:CRISPR-associated protein Cas1
MPPPGHTAGPRAVLIPDQEVFRRITAMPTLEAAWTRVFTNGGASGGDGVTLRRVQPDAPRRLARLQAALLDGSYTPGPLRHAAIPKADGSQRQLSIPCVIDRIAQSAALAVLGPLIDAELEDSSFAYRTGRSVQDAVARVRELRARGHVFVVDADIEDFFASVPHDKLMARLAESMTDGPATRLIALWLESGAAGGRGIPQGSPISPLLANLYLDRLDEAFSGRDARIVRFADDFLILAASRAGAEAALAKTRTLLAEHGLALNAEKSRITSFDQGFRFLGHLFVRSMILAQQADDAPDETTALLRALDQADARAERSAEQAEAHRAEARRHGLDPGQRSLYIVAADHRLALRNQGFAVQQGETGADGQVAWHEVLSLHHTSVDRIELGPDGVATMQALRHCLATDTALAFVNGHGETLGWLAPRFGPRAGRQLAQARFALDAAPRLELARRFVDGRLRNHRALLRRLNRDRQAPELVRPLADLNALIRGISRPATLAELMAHEGRAAALFWPAFGRLLEGDFNFRLRRREGALDPVNIMLNVTANLLTRDVTVALDRAGLHPGFGMLHATADGRDAAVYDLMEEFRAPMAESPVAQALNTRAVSAADFEPRDDGGSRLLPSGYRALIRTYERAATREVAGGVDGARRTWRGVMLDQAQALAAHVEGRGSYAPYVLDY